MSYGKEIKSTEPDSPAEEKSRLHRTDGLRSRQKAGGRAGMGL